MVLRCIPIALYLLAVSTTSAALVPCMTTATPPIERIAPHIDVVRQPGGSSKLSQEKHLLAALLSSFAPTNDHEAAGAGAAWAKSLSTKLEKDEVARVLDPNTVKLKRSGLVSFAAVQTPSGYNDKARFPDCMAKSPSFRVRQLLPPGTKVGVRFVEDAGGSRPRGALIVSDGVLVNGELVRTGFARPVSRGRDVSERILPGFTDGLASLQRDAQKRGLGMYTRCEEVETAADDQFEPLESTLQTKWGEDGGRPFVFSAGERVQPPNPGDTRGCSDFETYEDALRWYERYYPYYGDVARLDRDLDGIPCPGLPHTTDQSKYRMKVPSRQSASSQTQQ